MLSFSKKLFAITILTLFIAVLTPPVFAQTSAATEPPTACWTKDLCEKTNISGQRAGWAQTAESKKICSQYQGKLPPLGFCYAPQAKVNLQVAIGNQNAAATLTEYIPNAYNYLLGIVSIAAIIMIMVGGLRYLTAGGNASAVSSAKETILGAVIGLFLTFGSYILLQTVNPALTQLKMPDIKMVRTSALTSADTECPADSPQKTSKVALTNCSNNCDCFSGQTCEPVEGSAGQIIGASKLVVWSATAVAGGAVVAGTPVASGARYIVKGSYNILKSLASKLIKFVIKNPVEVAGGTIAYMALNSLGGSPADTATQSVNNGICVQLAKNSIPAGGLCAFNSNCISGKCLDITTQKELTTETLGEIGACVGDPKVFEGTLACREDSTCVANAGPNMNLKCVGGLCSFGTTDQTCCTPGKVGGTNQACGKGFNICSADLNCGFYFGTTLYPTNGLYTADTDPALLKALATTLQNSSGRCIDANNNDWAKY